QIIESKFKPESKDWESTSIVANMNMSWCGIPDAQKVQKYSARSLPPGSELVDFVSGPYSDAETPPWFVIRIDPEHSQLGFVVPVFTTKGVYKFVMQISGPGAGKPEQLTLFVDWNGEDFTIRSVTNEILEPKK